jgi:hypothetical protein
MAMHKATVILDGGLQGWLLRVVGGVEDFGHPVDNG